MTPTVLGLVIVNEAGLHHLAGGVAFRKVLNCRMLKIRISHLKSAGCNLLKFQKVKKNTLYVYFITRLGQVGTLPKLAK